MNGIRVNLAGQRLGWLTMLRMNATQTLFIQEDTGPILAMIQTPCGSQRNDQGSIHGDAIGFCPSLFFDPPLFFFGDSNLMFPAAASTVVATPVLQHRKNDAIVSH
jgi:hypothetical protein